MHGEPDTVSDQACEIIYERGYINNNDEVGVGGLARGR